MWGRVRPEKNTAEGAKRSRRKERRWIRHYYLNKRIFTSVLDETAEELSNCRREA